MPQTVSINSVSEHIAFNLLRKLLIWTLSVLSSAIYSVSQTLWKRFDFENTLSGYFINNSKMPNSLAVKDNSIHSKMLYFSLGLKSDCYIANILSGYFEIVLFADYFQFWQALLPYQKVLWYNRLLPDEASRFYFV